MNHERDQAHARATSGPSSDLDPAQQPGRGTRTNLDGPNGQLQSGLLQRKASGTVGPDAEQAVGAASGSNGHALPLHLKEKFEGSLGTDLSDVRLHTGTDSAKANDAVGARAYATGNDIHFAEGAYDPHSSGGQELIAHEVAHTVQQRGGSPTRQNKLEVSSPGDHAEVEADRAASAMVTGASATVGGMTAMLHRAPGTPVPSNSYNQGELHWEDSGSAVEEADAAAFGKKKAELVVASAGSAAAAVGLSAKPGAIGAKILTDSLEKYQTELATREMEVTFFQGQVKNGDASKKEENTQRLAQATLGRDALVKSREAWWAHSFDTAAKAGAQVQGFVGQMTGAGNKALVSTGLLKTEMFKNIDDASAKITKAIEVTKVMVLLCDTTTLSNLQANPSYEAAKLWANHITQTIGSLSAIGEVPGPWGPVISGLLQTPAAVVNAFEGILEAHYAQVDALLKGQFNNGEVILPGHSGGTPQSTD